MVGLLQLQVHPPLPERASSPTSMSLQWLWLWMMSTLPLHPLGAQRERGRLGGELWPRWATPMPLLLPPPLLVVVAAEVAPTTAPYSPGPL